MIWPISLIIILQILATLSQAVPRADTVFTTFLFKPLSNSFFLSPTVVHLYRKFKIFFLVLDLGKHVAPLAFLFLLRF